MPIQELKTKQEEKKWDSLNGRDVALESLVEKAMNGDSYALYALCEKMARHVLFHTIHLIHNKADAEDVSQEVLLRICEKIGELRSPAAFKGWVSKITTNAVNMHFRKTASSNVVNVDDYLESVMEKNDDFLPQEYAENREYREAIIEIVDGLPKRQRQAIFLHYYCGLSVTEVAEEMDIKHPSAVQYLALAREKIRIEVERRMLPTRSAPRNPVSFVAVGVALADILHYEAELLPVSEAWMQQTMAQCSSFLQLGAPQVPDAPKSTARSPSSSLKPVVGMVAAVAVMVGGALGIKMRDDAMAPPPSSQSSASISGTVAFSGGTERGEGFAYYNPTGASLTASSENGETTVLEWWIVPHGGEEVIYSSGSHGLEDAFAMLREQEKTGVYMLYYRIEDEAGYVYKIGSNFSIGP